MWDVCIVGEEGMGGALNQVYHVGCLLWERKGVGGALNLIFNQSIFTQKVPSHVP